MSSKCLTIDTVSDVKEYSWRWRSALGRNNTDKYVVHAYFESRAQFHGYSPLKLTVKKSCLLFCMQQVSYCGHLTIPLQLFCNLCVNFLRLHLQRLRRVHTIFYSLRFLFQTYNSLYQTSTPWKVKSAFAKTGIFGYNGLCYYFGGNSFSTKVWKLNQPEFENTNSFSERNVQKKHMTTFSKWWYFLM